MSKRTAFVLHRSLTSAVSEDKREHRGSKQAVVVGKIIVMYFVMFDVCVYTYFIFAVH